MNKGFYEDYWKESGGWSPSAGNVTAEESWLFQKYILSQEKSKVLDYGCGDAKRYGKFLVEQGVDYHGSDISKEAVAAAAERGVKVGLINTDGTTALPSDTVDVAICFEVFEHLQDPEAARDDIARCLKPGGRLLASVPNFGYWINRIEFLVTGELIPGGSPITGRSRPWVDPHIRFFNVRSFRRFLANGRLEIEKQFGVKWSLADLPYVWKRDNIREPADLVSRPFGFLGKALPGLLSNRLFAVARKV